MEILSQEIGTTVAAYPAVRLLDYLSHSVLLFACKLARPATSVKRWFDGW